MRKLFLVSVLVLIVCSHAWAIAFVNGTKATSSGGAVATLTATYSPTAGNNVTLFLITAGAVTGVSCVDNNSNALTPGTTITNTDEILPFSGTAVSGATSYKCTWTTTRGSTIVLGEYSGVSSFNLSLSGNTASGSTSPATITATTQDNNDFFVCGLSDGANAITVTTGNSREAETTGPKSVLVDNTSATPGGVTCAGTLTASAWVAAGVELRTSATVSTQFDKRRKLARLGVFD
jgi:hypothetical protein